jgi:hypothetical protein
MSDNPGTTTRWWQTMPGILTGVAAIITAITGLIVAFNRTGGKTEDVRPPASVERAKDSPRETRKEREASARGDAGRAQEVALPAVRRIKLAGGDAVITILSVEVEPIDLQRRSLTFKLRFLNGRRFPSNFWSSSFRLIVDDVPRAPTNSLNEVVNSNSAKEGDVVFDVPARVKDVVLQISAGDDSSRIPFTLP